MATDYTQRLRIPIVGCDAMPLSTHCGLLVATGYERVVIGARGPYIELLDRHIVTPAIAFHRECYYYDWWQATCPCHAKLYHQAHAVDYADYVVGRWYISPWLVSTPTVRDLVAPIKPVQLTLFD